MQGHDGPAVIDPEHFGNVSRMFDHACKPTLLRAAVEWKGQEGGPLMFLYAGRDLPEGQQLTWDYGRKGKTRGFACLCDSCDKGFSLPAPGSQRRRGGGGASGAGPA